MKPKFHPHRVPDRPKAVAAPPSREWMRARWAARVVGESSREQPMDRVLRRTLKEAVGLEAEDRAWISRAVFAHQRWLGWLETAGRPEERVVRALKLQEQFHAAPESFTETELTARAVPQWVWQEVEPRAAWLRSIQCEPRLWLRARRGRADSLADTPGHMKRPPWGALPEALEYQGGQDLFRTAAFHRGDFELQDIASQAVGCCCDPVPGDHWWDMCAGEGGKTLDLSERMRNRGLIVATDRAGWRLGVLRRRAARAGAHNWRAKHWIEGSRAPTRTRFDGVLLDAPCSGLGTWARNPHARWTLLPRDVAELSAVQWRLLNLGAAQVKPGGKLLYAVCTLTRTETSDLAMRFDRECPGFEPLPLTDPFENRLVHEGKLTWWPEITGGNGMFIAGWRRVKDG